MKLEKEITFNLQRVEYSIYVAIIENPSPVLELNFRDFFFTPYYSSGFQIIVCDSILTILCLFLSNNFTVLGGTSL